MNLFQKARIKLTLWYLIITSILLFAASIAAITAEVRAFDRIEAAIADRTERPRLSLLLETRLNQFERDFIRRLFLLDGFLIIVAAGGSYFLSGRTLAPISDMVKKQEDFAADVSHKLRTPLTTMNMEIEALKRTEKNLPTKYKLVLDRIRSDLSSMSAIVDGLLTLVRGKTFDLNKHGKVFDLHLVAQKVLNEMQTLAKKKSLKFSLQGSKNLKVFGIEEQIKQAVTILVDNAIAYTQPHGRITIKTDSKSKTPYLSVSDSGYGIPSKDLPHIFERFYRVQNKDVGKKGTGLGLAIAKQIVESHNGTLGVESTEGKGSTFTITLPQHS